MVSIASLSFMDSCAVMVYELGKDVVLKDRIDKWCDRAGSAKNDQDSDEEKDNNDRGEPPFFSFSQKMPKVFQEFHSVGFT